MNIYKLITPVNRYNYVNNPYLKRDLDYYSQHYSDTNNDNDEFSFMKRKKLSTNIYGMKYNDDYLIPKINVISNAMKVDIQDRTPLSKRLPEVMHNPYIPFGDPNTKYDELITASQQMLSSVEPINYFGCRIVGDYLYNFDIGMIFKIIPKDFLARFIDPTLIKESTVYVDSRSAMIMPQKSAFKNIWMNTKTYIPVNPKYVETIDINSLIEPKPIGVNLNEIIPDSYYTSDVKPIPIERPIAEQPVRSDSLNHSVLEHQPVEPVRQPVEQPVRQPVEQPVIPPVEPVRSDSLNHSVLEHQPVEHPVEQPVREPVITEQPVEQPVERPISRNIPIGEIPPLFFDQPVVVQPVIESNNNVLEQQQQQEQRKRKILDESLNEQQQQQPRRRRKPKMNETK